MRVLVNLFNYPKLCCFALFGALVLSCSSVQAQSSVLNSGDWYKLAVEKNGVYKVTYEHLKKMGVDPGKADPRRIQIFGNGGGMLPQANSTLRPVDLIENSIFVKGESDGKFDKEDFILFFAQGPDKAKYDIDRQAFFYEHNLYADKNFYFLTLATSEGKRLELNENSNTNALTISVFDDFIYHEIDSYNELKSGREWFGEKFDLTTEHALQFDVTGIQENTDIKLVSDVMAQSYIGSSFKLFFNNIQVGEQTVFSIPNSQYAAKGLHSRDTLSFSSTTVSAPTNTKQEIKYQYLKSAGRSIGYLDFFLLSFSRQLSLYGDQTIFRSSKSLENPISTFELNQLPDNCTIWEISNALEPRIQPFNLLSGTASFSASTDELREYVIFNNNIPAPEFISKVPNQNLHGLSTPKLIIITHPDFKSEALRLANHRESHGVQTVVVSTEEVYNEFSSGRQDVSAIRDFAKYLNDKSPGILKAILLVGRGSYDYKKRISNNTNFVPIYESANSLYPLETYSSDDYYGFLENSEGTWKESPAEEHTMDIGVGRLPVKTLDEARNVVDKLIVYDTDAKAFGRWRKEIVFVADDGDGNTHQKQANQLANKVENNHPEFNAKRIFVDASPQISKPSGEVAPDVNKSILEAIDRGSLIINYTGHGAEKLWAQERIFDDFMIEDLDNKTFPLFVTATCEFGRNDDPGQISSAELGVLRKNSGAIGMITTARPVNSAYNYDLNQAFYDALLQKESNQYLSVGEIFRRTKNNSINSVYNRNFSLLGDPSMTLAFPQYKIQVDEIKTLNQSDTLSALSTVRVRGEIVTPEGEKAVDFSGTLDATVFDKQTSFTTLGNENPPYTYGQWFNLLFRGKSTVQQGEFQFDFIVPKNIAYQIGNGKLSLYAYDETGFRDAGGAEINFKIGTSDPEPSTDITAPTIELFMGDTTFTNGGIVNPKTQLVVKLKDANGINISGYGIGNSILAILDDSQTFVLNDYYDADMDDFTTGWITYPLKDLAPGKHTITVKAWDTYNNPAEASIDFRVTEGEGLVIESWGNFPNPFQETTTLFFTHNRAGDDLQANVYIYNLAGQLMSSDEFLISESQYQVDLVELDNTLDLTKKLTSGVYLARVVVRSVTNGSKNERVAKLIVLN